MRAICNELLKLSSAALCLTFPQNFLQCVWFVDELLHFVADDRARRPPGSAHERDAARAARHHGGALQLSAPVQPAAVPPPQRRAQRHPARAHGGRVQSRASAPALGTGLLSDPPPVLQHELNAARLSAARPAAPPVSVRRSRRREE